MYSLYSSSLETEPFLLRSSAAALRYGLEEETGGAAGVLVEGGQEGRRKLEMAGFPIFSPEEGYYPMQLVSEEQKEPANAGMGEVHDQDSMELPMVEDGGNAVEPILDEASSIVNLCFGELWMALDRGDATAENGRAQHSPGFQRQPIQDGPLAIVHPVHPQKVEEKFRKWKSVTERNRRDRARHGPTS